MIWRCLVLGCLLQASAWGQDFLIVTSTDTRIESLSRFQLREIYLGKLKSVEGVVLRPVQVKRKDHLRKSFERFVFSDRFDVNEYWLITKLQGGPDPPLTVNGWGLVLAYTSRNPGFVGYIPADKESELGKYGLKVIALR
ncbi:hypothetical protein SCOR_09560 [Sulfidibacter corallicola]|uniref:Phosphate ABC transporter substrate-binding protein n=1 Tax=Sulfidibacter corallicola TaxID=2818388 RepID=A0A8A4TPU3_SULCO|nr:hypothetical protein [Sulfidibacter corallicola]QTD50998.1 hypothetical protein J3U87_00885 [Sulfidibacter corallicola]